MGAGGRPETPRSEAKDFIPPRAASSVFAPGFPCPLLSRGRHDLGQMERTCTESCALGEGHGAWEIHDFDSQQYASLFCVPRETWPHLSRFLADDTTLRNGPSKEQSVLVSLAHTARCIGAWVPWRNVVNICWMNEWKKPSLVTRYQELMPADGLTWSHYLPGSLPLTYSEKWEAGSFLPPLFSALTTPHSCPRSLWLTVCWDWQRLLLPPEPDTTFCLLDGGSP